jgi:ribonuclease G
MPGHEPGHNNKRQRIGDARLSVSIAMTEDILINITPQETRVAIVQQAPCRNCMSSAR